MTVNYSDFPTFKGFFAPTRFEADVYDCEVTGKIPTELNGAFYRVGADWFYPPMHADDSIAFNGDGYVTTFRIANGSVDFKSRYVRTERYLADRKARKQLYGYYRNRKTDDATVRQLSGTTANTNIVAHAGKLFALKEDALPVELDPNTLETRGFWNFHDQYKSLTFTAHPKMDPVTGEMICFGYEATGAASNDIFFYSVDKHGKVTREVRFKAPYVSMVHDIAISEKHIIIPVFGFVTSKERLDAGKVHWGWDSSKPTYVGILPRDGDGKDVRWFKGPERAAVHTFNAVTKGNKVIMEAPISDSNPFPFFPPIDGSPWNPQKARTTVRRWSFDLGSKHDSFEEVELYPDHPGALSRVDDRYLSLPYRYGFMGYNDAKRPFDHARAGNAGGRINNCYGKFDFATGKVESFFVGDVHSLQECSFIPRSKDAPEGDGYLVGVASNFAEMCSEMVIVDTAHMGDGEVARVKLPFRLSSQIHGNWVTADQLPLVEPT